MTPRAYQSTAIANCKRAFYEGARAVCLVSPTGSGKTFMGAVYAAGHLSQCETNRVVWLAHRVELLDQAASTLRSFGLEVGVRGASRTARVQVESVQTIIARETSPEGTLLIPDECHHFAEDNRCGDIVKAAPWKILGLTATPERGDGKPLKPPFDRIVVAAQISDLIRDGHLVPLRIKWPGKLLGKKFVAARPVDWYLAHARGRRGICFAGNLKTAAVFRDDFVALGVRAAVIDGKLRKDVRKGLLERHQAGLLGVLVNVGVLTEGYDDPAVSCIIVARGCGSQGLWLQMIGRGLRPAPGKSDCLLLDMRGVTGELGRPDADREFRLEGDPIAVKDRDRANTFRICRSCQAPLGDLVRCPECGFESPLPQYAGIDAVDFDDVVAMVKGEWKPRKDALALAGMLRKVAPGKANQARPAIVLRFRAIFRREPDELCWRQAIEYNRRLRAVESNLLEASR